MWAPVVARSTKEKEPKIERARTEFFVSPVLKRVDFVRPTRWSSNQIVPAGQVHAPYGSFACIH